MATCPQCKARFRFRTLASESAPVALVAPATPVVPEKNPVAAPPVSTTTAETAESVASETSAEISEEAPAPVAKPVQLTPVQPGPEQPGPDGAAGKQADSPLRGKNGALDDNAYAAGTAETEWLDVPWERPERYGHLMGLYQTIVRVMFNAPRFFATLGKCRGSVMRPLLFYVLLGLFQTLVKLAWFQSVAPSVTDPQVQELLSSADMSVALTLVVAPALLAAQLFLYSALFFLMLRLVQPEQVVFPTVLRVVAYSSAPMIVCAVPVLGPVVGLVWFAACCFMGCRFALNLQWHKVALALVPLYLIGFVITMQFVEHLLQQG